MDRYRIRWGFVVALGLWILLCIGCIAVHVIKGRPASGDTIRLMVFVTGYLVPFAIRRERGGRR